MNVRILLAGLVGVAFTCGATSACSSSDTPAGTADAGAEAAPGPGTDGGGGTDSGGGIDSGAAGTCKLSYAGCVAQTMVDVGATDTTVKFGVNGLTYEPKCLRIKAGQTVTFEGSFPGHNLKPATCNPPGGANGADDTIPVVKTGTTATVKFTKPGVYAYYCDFHGDPAGSDSLMDGLVEVVP